MKQDIYQLSPTPNYPIGFPYPVVNPLDLRRFHYGLAGNTLCTDFGAKQARVQDIGFTTIHAAVAQGSRLVSIDVGATDGPLGTGVFAKDELAGGNIVIFTHSNAPAAGSTYNRMIVGNTATTGAGVMVVTVDKPLPVPLTIAAPAMHAECIANPYLNVQYLPADSPYKSVVGMPTMPAAVGQYLWLQTWGPLWINCDLNVSVAQNSREVVFGPDGSLHPTVAGDAFNTTQGQRAGFVLANGPAHVQGAPFIFLQITP